MRLFCILLAILVSGCDQQPPANSTIDASTQEAAKPWTNLAVNDADGDFSFVVVTDRTCCHRPGVFAGAMPKINLLEPAFVVSVGDLIEGYTENQARLDAEWDEMEGFIAELETPFFYTPGNHDMNNAVMAETWQRRFGASYYHFVYKDVLFLILNSELFGMVGAPDIPLPGPWQQSEQMTYVEGVLNEQRDARWTVVLLHQPLWDMAEIDEDWLAVEDMLGTRPYTVFAGHYHRYNLAQRHKRNYITLATTGGGSGLRGPLFGEFDHVAWVTMTDRGPRIANLLLDGIQPEDVATQTTRAEIDALDNLFEVTPTLASGEIFESAQISLRAHNPGKEELHLQPQVGKVVGFEVAGLAPISLSPGEALDIELSLTTDTPVPFKSIGTGSIDWTVTTEVDGRPLQFTKSIPVMPLTTHFIAETANAITIDGDLGEWAALPFAANRQGDLASPATDADDISFRFAVGRDNDNLYFAFDVTDDSLVLGADLLAREQDSIAVVVDARGSAQRAEAKSVSTALFDGTLESIVLTFLTPEPNAAEDELLSFLKDSDARTKRAVVLSEDGYRAELAIPFEVLNEQAGGVWQELRVGVRAYDFDADQHGSVVLHWQPYRFGNAPLTGTGGFTRKK